MLCHECVNLTREDLDDFRVTAVVEARACGEAIHEVARPCIGVECVADRLFRPLEGCGAKSIAGDRVDVVDDLIRAFTESRHSGKELAGEFGLADRDIGNDLKLLSRPIDVAVGKSGSCASLTIAQSATSALAVERALVSIFSHPYAINRALPTRTTM